MRYTKEYYTKDNYSIFRIDEFEKKYVPNGEQSPKVIEWLKTNEFEVVDFVPIPLADYKVQQIENVNQMSFNLRNEFLPDYKLINAGIDVYEDESPGTKVKYKNTVKAFRTEFYRLKGLIESAKSNDEIDLIVTNSNFPKGI